MKLLGISGLSGSGKSTALRTLEGPGFYCIDSLPVLMLPRLGELPSEQWDNVLIRHREVS